MASFDTFKLFIVIGVYFGYRGTYVEPTYSGTELFLVTVHIYTVSDLVEEVLWCEELSAETSVYVCLCFNEILIQ